MGPPPMSEYIMGLSCCYFARAICPFMETLILARGATVLLHT